MTTRIETDSLGERAVPADALYGIHTLRACENFPLAGRSINPALIHAYGFVKEACLQAAHEQTPWSDATWHALRSACRELQSGSLDANITVDALQGGAGTSTNLNICEVITNRALSLLGHPPGSYTILDPLHDANRFQSTNDTYPTALRLAAIRGVTRLSLALTSLQQACEAAEQKWAHIVKVGRTQLQDAVLTTAGRTFSAFAEAFARDRWRIYKCEERLRVINLGGTAIGSGIGAPRAYIFRATEVLRALTGIGFARAENLTEATQNADVFVEVSGMLKACATNFCKIGGDLRLLASGPDTGFAELHLAPRQTGSSIMPGKYNPVIPEAVIQAALRVQANDQLITSAASMGNLELNAFMPAIADALLESLHLLGQSANMLADCIADLQVNEAACRRQTENSVATATALATVLGYHAAQNLLAESRKTGTSLRELALSRHSLAPADFDALISPETVTRLGQSLP
jgi:aspartate ammonia-lyase